eukprot:gene19242-21882_t
MAQRTCTAVPAVLSTGRGADPEIYDPRCTSKVCIVGGIKKYSTLPCFSVEKNDDHSNLTCSIGGAPSLCPIKNEQVDVGLRSQRAWIKSSPLCNLRNSLPNHKQPATLNNNVSIIVFGGSVTAGVSTQGCCDQTVCTEDKYYSINDYCNWVKYMGRWFSTFGPNVKTYNLAHAGYNSDTYKDRIVEKLNLIRPNFMFKKSDVVFLDLSVNDANTFESTPTKMLILERGLEALIRRIYWLSEPASMPTIVILEMWMGSPAGAEYTVDTGYTLAYERIARHYNVTLWSYRDMVREMHSNRTESKLVEYLDYHNNYKESTGHPPWHVHLFYADFVTAMLRNQMEHCDESPAATTYPVIKSPQELPVPLVAHKFLHCDPDQPPLLSITSPQVAHLRSAGGAAASPPPALGTSPHDIMVAPNVPAYFSTPASAWNVIEDKKGRPGFIHEFVKDDRAGAVLTFHLNITHEELASHDAPKILQILFLRSYANAGKVQLLFCGKAMTDGRYELVTLDALWGDYKTFKFSLPEVYSIDLTTQNCGGNEGKKHVAVQIVHNYDPHAQGEEKTARGNQKFKLVDIKVCYSSNKRS